MQKTFQVLPTDSRFQDLTDEQLDLIYEHMLLDTLPKKSPAYSDPDYPNEGSDQEIYNDPDFDDVWNAGESGEENQFEDIETIGEKQSFESFGEEHHHSDVLENVIEDNEWEEV